MKKLLLFMAIAAVGLGACDDRRPQPLTIDNALTADEIAAGRLTPEVMWKMSRAGSSSLSPDGRTLLYQQTDYNMAENRGVTTAALLYDSRIFVTFARDMPPSGAGVTAYQSSPGVFAVKTTALSAKYTV